VGSPEARFVCSEGTRAAQQVTCGSIERFALRCWTAATETMSWSCCGRLFSPIRRPGLQKGKGLLAGTATIYVINFLRIISLFYLGQYDVRWFEFAHLYVWESVFVLLTLTFFWMWVRRMAAPRGRKTLSYRDKKVVITGGLGFIGSNPRDPAVEAGGASRHRGFLGPGCGANPYKSSRSASGSRCVLTRSASRNGSRSLAASDVVFNLAGEISHVHSMDFPERDMRLTRWRNCSSWRRAGARAGSADASRASSARGQRERAKDLPAMSPISHSTHRFQMVHNTATTLTLLYSTPAGVDAVPCCSPT